MNRLSDSGEAGMRSTGAPYGCDASGRPLDQVKLVGISATGYHGVFEHERREGQTFVADVVAYLDTRRAAAGDDLTHTLHYGDLAEEVVAVLEGDPVDLIETVAERIAATVLAHSQVAAVDVAVHKPQAPLTVPFTDVVVEVHRDRAKLPAAEPWRPAAVVAPATPRGPAPTAIFPRIAFDAAAADPAGAVASSGASPSVPSPSVPSPSVPGSSTPTSGTPSVSAPSVSTPSVSAPGTSTPGVMTPGTGASVLTPSVAPSVPGPSAALPVLGPPAGASIVVAGATAATAAPAPPAAPAPLLWSPVSGSGENRVVARDASERTWFGPTDGGDAPPAGPPAGLGTDAGTAVGPHPTAEQLPVAPQPTVTPAADSASQPVLGDALDRVPVEPVDVVIALGANLGPAQATLRDTVSDLARVRGLTVLDVSPLARTASVGGPDQPDYLNAIVLARTSLSARELLHATQGIEQSHGRERNERWGPRTLDIDLIVYGSTLAVTDDLELPHPRANQRAFVLEPWVQIDPDAVLPGLGGGPVAALAATAPDRDGIRWLALDWLTSPAPAAAADHGDDAQGGQV